MNDCAMNRNIIDYIDVLYKQCLQTRFHKKNFVFLFNYDV